MIHVIATVRVRPGTRAGFLEKFRALVPQVLAENGCVAYTPTIDAQTEIGRQQRCGEDVVTVIEQWESVAALQAHLVAPHMETFREGIRDLVVDMTIQILAAA